MQQQEIIALTIVIGTAIFLIFRTFRQWFGKSGSEAICPNCSGGCGKDQRSISEISPSDHGDLITLQIRPK